MLRYTGHPFVDVGVATITAFAGKPCPQTVTKQCLERVADYIAKHYPQKYMASFLTCVFPNSAYVNPTMGEAKKRDFLCFHIYGFRNGSVQGHLRCVPCGRPAVGVTFRQHVPLLTGEDVLNFFPNAEPGLPLCSLCRLSIAALPLGALKCSGRALIIHADDSAVTLEFARERLQHNQQVLQLASQLASQGAAKYPDAKHVQTRLMEQLCAWTARQDAETRAQRPLSLTAYHLSNSGQGPELNIYHLPTALVGFVRAAMGAQYANRWKDIIQRAWWAKRDMPGDPPDTRNVFYEDLLRLPDMASIFIRRYFLRQAYRKARKDDPRGSYRLACELDLVSWPLTDLFLRKVLNMEKPRIEAIRVLGDRLADYIATQNDRAFWRSFYRATRYFVVRNALIKASASEIRAGRKPLITFDDFIAIFESGEELPHTDWGLARDLVLIRLIEQLHAKQWFMLNTGVLPEEDEVADATTETSDVLVG